MQQRTKIQRKAIRDRNVSAAAEVQADAERLLAAMGFSLRVSQSTSGATVTPHWHVTQASLGRDAIVEYWPSSGKWWSRCGMRGRVAAPKDVLAVVMGVYAEMKQRQREDDDTGALPARRERRQTQTGSLDYDPPNLGRG